MKKLKEEHHEVVSKLKEEIDSLQDLEASYKDQISQVHRAMNLLGVNTDKKLDAKNQEIKKLED